jgi:hypothetical protein
MSLIGPSDEPNELEPPYIVTDLWVLAHRTPRLIKLKHVHDVISAEAHDVMQDLILAQSMECKTGGVSFRNPECWTDLS